MTIDADVKAILAELEGMGATVKLGPASSDAQLEETERVLAFALPDEYKELLRTLGRIEIELVRTWHFYGLPEDRKIKQLYADEFEPFRADDGDDGDGAYYPRRFVVLADEGDFSNAAEGYVWDGDLGHIRFTAGGDYLERSEFLEVGYWGFLSDQLEEIRDRIADPSDPLVGGSEAEVNARRKLPR